MLIPIPSPALASVTTKSHSAPSSPTHTPRKLLRRVGSDITNLHSAPVPLESSPKREGRSFALMEKDVRAYDALEYGDKQWWLDEHRLTYDKLHDYRRQVNARLAMPKKDRPNLQRRRLKSGGRKARLPKEVEDRIFAWVMDRRGGNPDGFYHVVTVSQLLFHACILSGKQLLEGWLWGFMERYGLSLRCVTTNKAIDTPLIKAVSYAR
jgi:hypothetical protein